MHDIVSRNRKTYSLLADEYEEKVEKRIRFNTKVISRFIRYIKTGKRILDIGCAVGLDSSIFFQKGFNVLGIDISSEMIKLARERAPDCKFIVGDFMELNFDKKFDAIFAQAYIHLYPKLKAGAVLQKMFDVLKTGGVAFITTSKSTESKEGWFEKIDYKGRHKRFRKFWTKNELSKILVDTSFNIGDYYEINDPFDKCWMVFTVRK